MRTHTIVEKLVIIFLLGLLTICLPWRLLALEFQADKNVAFTFQGPLVNSTNTSIYAIGANNTAFYTSSNDNTTWVLAGTNITHIGSGWYNWTFNQSEMNHNRVNTLYNGTGCVQQGFVINTLPKTNITADIAATLTAVNTRGVSNLTTADLGGLTNVTLAATQTGVTIPTVTAVTNNVTVTNCDVATSTRGTSNLTPSDNIGINLGDVSNPTTALNLTGTEIKGVNNPVSLNATIAY